MFFSNYYIITHICVNKSIAYCIFDIYRRTSLLPRCLYLPSWYIGLVSLDSIIIATDMLRKDNDAKEVTSQGMDLEFTVSYEFSTMSYTTHYLPSTLPMWTLISTYLESIMSLKDPKSGQQLFLRLICMCDYLQ